MDAAGLQNQRFENYSSQYKWCDQKRSAITIPGVIIITAGGFLTAIYGRIPILGTGWILWSIILFSISGIVFGIKVAPLQKKLALLTSSEDNFNWDQFLKVFKQWEFWGLIALLTPIAAMIMMILKMPS